MSDKVKKGFYLVTIAHCMECHTPMEKGARQWDAAWAPAALNFPVHGASRCRATSRRARPRASAPGATTRSSARSRPGVSKDGSKLKPPMGYQYYATLTPDDLDAIVAYLRTVPAVE